MAKCGPKPRPLVERFWAKVEITPTCWLWRAGFASKGYGQIRIGAERNHFVLAHRVAYELLIGPIPKGLQIDHLCRNRACVNPEHLEPVTSRENLLRGESFTGLNARKTHCVNGHSFDEANTLILPDGRRQCRACGTIRMRGYRQTRKENT